jgi:hypothetical protein
MAQVPFCPLARRIRNHVLVVQNEPRNRSRQAFVLRFAEEARTHRVKCSCPDDRVSHCRRTLAHDIRHNALNASNHLPGSAS